jgi:Ca2+-binding EF-hand superfamily protein
VHQICVDLGYDVDATYVQGVMDQFAKFDGDGDGQIEFVEFAALWDYLGGEERAVEAEKSLKTPRGTVLAEERRTAETAGASGALRSKFESLDSGGKGYLSSDDLATMMAELGYETSDAEYRKGLMHNFARFDKDADGRLEFEEFELVWRHFGGETAHDAAEEATAAQKERDPHGHFGRYDTNNSGTVSRFEVDKLMTDLGYDVDSEYPLDTYAEKPIQHSTCAVHS